MTATATPADVLEGRARWCVVEGDCLATLAALPDCCVGAVVTDPPYELGFMGKAWDAAGIAFSVALWREVLRVLKPGGHLLAFGGTRTYHRMTCAIEDAGFEVRDSLHWLYGTGFPKSLNVGKAIDDAAGAVREVVGRSARHVSGKPEQSTRGLSGSSTFAETVGMGQWATAPATDAARQWEGWGTALKPAHEPIVLARKPLIGTVAANVLAHGTGALNIDGCRIATSDNLNGGTYSGGAAPPTEWLNKPRLTPADFIQPAGRWPANVLLDPDAAAELDAQSGILRNGGQNETSPERGRDGCTSIAAGKGSARPGDTGGASRFFYVAKPSRSERDAGCDALPLRSGGEATDRVDGSAGLNSPRAGAGAQSKGGVRNFHPTVKPVDLMRHLVRLVTPPGGTVLDPFLGSGTTGIAARLEGFGFVGIEREAEYAEIARARISHRDAPAGQLSLLGEVTP